MTTATKRISVFILIILTLTILCLYAVQNYVKNSNAKTIDSITMKVTEQKLKLAALATLTRSNGADSVTDRFVVDCNAMSRQRFDTLLDTLSKNISNQDLSELKSLFYSCGSFYADRKATMAIKLEQEVDHLHTLNAIMATVTTVSDKDLVSLSIWKEIAEAELKTAEYFNSLVALQGTIITDLLSGKRADSPELIATLTEVNSIRGQMVVLSKQIEVNKTKLE